jgi:hypothetical protein
MLGLESDEKALIGQGLIAALQLDLASEARGSTFDKDLNLSIDPVVLRLVAVNPLMRNHPLKSAP